MSFSASNAAAATRSLRRQTWIRQPEVIETNAADIQKVSARAINELAAALEAGHSQRLKAYLAMLARFHRYSVSNLFLIMAQFPRATRVAGYRSWRSIGRQVRRGSKAISILAPVLNRKREGDKDEETAVTFRTVNVFDVSQTDGKPLSEFARVCGDPGEYASRLKGFVASRGITLRCSGATGVADGMSRGGSIILRRGLEPGEEFSVLVHELAHERLHQEKKSAQESRVVRETEAEAVSFVVCQAAGLDTNSAASDYIHIHQGNKKTLIASLERIQRAATAIIQGILFEKRLASA